MEHTYWDNFYAQSLFETPSPFCKYVIDKYLNREDSVIEIGCGEGRDGIEISKFVHDYKGIDKSTNAIEAANRKLETKTHNSKFEVGSFGDLNLEEFVVTPDRKSTRLNSSHIPLSRMPSSA